MRSDEPLPEQDDGQQLVDHAAGLAAYEPEQEPDMKTSQMVTSKYLRQEDIDGDTPVTIKGDVKKVNVAREDEDAEYRFTISFEEFDKPMVLNTTNIKRLEKFVGDDSALWDGQRVIIYVDDEVSFGGKVVGGLRIKAATKRNGLKATRATDDDVNAKLRAAQPDIDDEIPF